MDKITNDARIYTDLDGLERLRYQSRKDPEMAKKEVSRQFEALLMQIVLRSMRDANKAFSSDLFGGNQMELYQDMFDKQLTLVMANTGTGLADIIEKNIDQQALIHKKSVKDAGYIPQVDAQQDKSKSSAAIATQTKTLPAPDAKPKPTLQSSFNTQEEFVEKLWAGAKKAANLLGTDPKILLAQAALETNWGKKIIASEGDSTHNLFNIKADNAWKKNTTIMDTLEQKNGVLVKEKAAFRHYESFSDSFMDYVHFLKNNSRYSEALNKATNPKQFVHALQEAGFATDSHYAEKVLSIFSSTSFKNTVSKLP